MTEQSPFDILAKSYDKDFTRSCIGQLQRKRVWKLADQVLQSNNRPLDILEINCGTGEDAFHFSAMGHNVIATDASGIMIEKANQKAGLLKINTDKLQFIHCSFTRLPECFPDKKFDLIFSDFGGINCINEKEITQLSHDLSMMMAPGGQLFLVVLGRFCLWETGYYAGKKKLTTAFRRWKKNISFEVDGHEMPIFYYSPGHLRKLFCASFNCKQTFPVGLFIPPSYLENQFSNRGQLLNKLNLWEDLWGKYSLFSSFADHFCIIFERNSKT